MTGTIPVYKLHGSLNWSLTGQTVVAYQDMRPAFRHGGDAAIIPPIPEKLVPAWLKAIWSEAALYDDGGFSGGTMERPALKRLIAWDGRISFLGRT
jgi:hypothetical protein